MEGLQEQKKAICAQNYNLPQLQLNLLLQINQEFNLKKVVTSFLPAAVQLLNCSSGHIWLCKKSGQIVPEPFSYADIIKEPAELHAAIDQLLINYANTKTIPQDLLYLPSKEKLHNYFFPLADRGVLLLQAEIAHSPDELSNILQPVITKLATTCSLCQEYQYTEQKFNKIFEESPVSLWEQDLSATEAELLKLRQEGINQTNLRAFLLSHPELPLEFLKKLRVVNINKATLDMYGAKSKDEFVARVNEIYDAGPESRDGLFKAGEAIICGQKEFSFECVNNTLDGRKIYVIIRSSICSSDSGFSHVFSSIQDITEQKLATARFEYLATHDTLTLLPNRRSYEQFLERTLKDTKQNNKLIALLYVDIDHFKKINDGFGHNVGDALLQAYAKKLQAILPNDFVARLGGDEFAVICKEIASPESAGEIADKIKQQLDTYYKLDEHIIDIVSSIGIAVYPIAGNDFVELNKNADIALYAVKNSGRNNYKYFTPDDRYCGLINLENELAIAIEEEQLFLCYQPIYSYDKATIVGLEVLSRWQHPKFGLVMPKMFISLAEENGSIISLGYWTIATACKQYMRWFPAGKTNAVKLKINVSPKQLTHRNFLSTIKTIMQQTQINPKNLEFEITETALTHQPQLVEKVLKQIRNLGIRLALDDIGVGYSSLSSLSKLPISTIKIDQSFVRSIPANTKNTKIIKAILELARNLNVKVIVEGVENRTQVDFLADLGCNLFQGYYFYKPLKTPDITTLLQREHLLVITEIIK